MTERIPLFLLTGFLGSGKTTLLNYLVKQPAFANTLVIINELGDISLDHLLVSRSSEEQVVQLSSGCICCSIRGDLAKTLRDISWRFARNGQRQFDQVIIETTGLAAPGSIIHTVMAEPKIASQFRLQGVIVTVDAVNGLNTLARHREAQQQVAVADILLLSKTDLAPPASQAALSKQLAVLNPQAQQLIAVQGEIDPTILLALDHIEPQGSTTSLAQWLNTSRFSTDLSEPALLSPQSAASVHASPIQSHVFIIDSPIPFARFEQWLNAMVQQMAPNMLRIKGILHIAGFPGPMVIHGVQHIFHPAEFMSSWPDTDKRSRLVFITDGISREQLAQSLTQFGLVT
ncbi:ATP-binding protein [Arsukibacterium ikkense]|uniref:ATP-binding protein n=1 Tax=Arsukibacterium ikkense TaxID=336831 RepID=A0A0M2UZJ4_9GAMM|nr:GTP-binding protein [Arsukibacterium ikkense]KKO43972.1 ATP-binding protein [Arsukibacterium ikkense]